MTRIAVLASGRGSNLQSIIDNCGSGFIPGQVVVVVSDKKGAFALERAANHGIKGVFIDPSGRSREDFDMEIAGVLEAENVELVCLAGYMRLLSEPFVKRFYGRIMNIHPALLPSFPGLHGHKDALDYGVKVSGCTVHFVDEKVDHGPIIVQKAVPVEEGDSEDRLASRILREEHKAFSEAVKLFAEGRIEIDGRRVKIRR
ncbi:MAG: phosphoribosylglycinamide formyltransferase [Candidatus Altiarchaeota archaeon]